jgi:hypothetical protein
MSIQFWLKTGCDIGAGDSNSQVAVMVRAELGEVWSHEQEEAVTEKDGSWSNIVAKQSSEVKMDWWIMYLIKPAKQIARLLFGMIKNSLSILSFPLAKTCKSENDFW